MSASKCTRCGATVEDIDAGFSPGRHGMKHDCGGTWRVVDAVAAYVHEVRDGLWVVADYREADGSYTARLRDPQPGGLHSYQSRSLADLARADIRTYRTRSAALRAARRVYGEG